MREIAIIGGGASGIAAAIEAAERGARVSLLESGKRIGHSILVSGNGRCNFSNAHIDAQAYWNAPFVEGALAACPPAEVWRWFANLGLLWESESQGRLYPAANKASSVLDVLRFRLDELGVSVACERQAVRIAREDRSWRIDFAEGPSQHCDAVVLACGNQVTRALLPDGYRFMPRKPRLCALKTDAQSVKGLDNVRVHARAALLRAPSQGGRPEPVALEAGEVQFRSFGISGIAVFNLSRDASEGDVVELDLIPAVGQARLEGDIAARVGRWPARSAEQLLAGMALPLVVRAALRQAGLAAQAPLSTLDTGRVAQALKHYRLEVTGFEERNAQVVRGGVAVGQVDCRTMACKAHPGLFVTGEALDVDGPCGGFNLHWAWTSGILAGRAAAEGDQRA